MNTIQIADTVIDISSGAITLSADAAPIVQDSALDAAACYKADA